MLISAAFLLLLFSLVMCLMLIRYIAKDMKQVHAVFFFFKVAMTYIFHWDKYSIFHFIFLFISETGDGDL